jgi:hypothetical protein
MSGPYSLFVSRFLVRGAIGVSVGLSAVALIGTVNASQEVAAPELKQPFSERLQTLRSAIPESAKQSLGTKPVLLTQFRNIN